MSQIANDAPLILDITAEAQRERRTTPIQDRITITDRMGAYPSRWWHRVVFCVVAAGWTPLSLVAWLAIAIAVFGWRSDGSFDSPSIVAEPTSAAVFTTVMAALILAIGAVVLFSLARWSIPERRRISVAAAVIAIGWAPVVATVWTIAR